MPPTDTPATAAPPSLRALFFQLFDYAGQYPPARLSLEAALGNYARYRQGPDAWMLSRFVHPVDRLDALDAHGHLFTQDPPFRFSLLGTGGSEADAFLGALENDLERIQAFHERHRDRVLGDVMEVRFPKALLSTEAADVKHFLDEVSRRIIRAGLPQLALFYEAPLGDAADALPALLTAMAEHNSRQPTPARSAAGLKMRCGGMAPVYAPTPDELAFAIDACRRAGVHFKVTAGLHHPVRHYNEEAGETMHGLFNVFGAAALAFAHGSDLGPGALRAVLADDNPDHFRFTPEVFAWRDLTVSLDDLRRAREALAISVGSCSFDEPRDDLRAMGLL